MNYNYLDIFPNLFFNIETNEYAKQLVQQVNELFSDVIIKFGELENEISMGISKQDDFIDGVICSFIRKIIEQLDAINVLYSVGSFTTSQIILRTLIENIISLKFILQEEKEIPTRAAAYFLEYYFQEIELGDSSITDGTELNTILKHQGKEQLKKYSNELDKKKEALKKIINKNPLFQKIDRERQNKINNKNNKKVYIEWYQVCSNVSNFRGLMKETGYEKYYQGLYGIASREAHSLNSANGIIVKKNGFFLKKIRNMENGAATVSLACTFSFELLKDLYKYVDRENYNELEFAEFYKKFNEKQKNIEQALKNFNI